MVEEGKFRVDKFNGQNYQLWKMQMEDYMYQKYLYLPLGGKAKHPAAIVVRISPYYRGRNGSLLSIGQKGRFLLVGKCWK